MIYTDSYLSIINKNKKQCYIKYVEYTVYAVLKIAIPTPNTAVINGGIISINAFHFDTDPLLLSLQNNIL